LAPSRLPATSAQAPAQYHQRAHIPPPSALLALRDCSQTRSSASAVSVARYNRGVAAADVMLLKMLASSGLGLS
jgi:hypothetical protein